MPLKSTSCERIPLLNWALFLFSLAVILGPAYALLDSFHYVPAEHHDLKTYLGLANFDFDQSPIRRYRIIVPMLAAGIEWLFGSLFARVEPWYFPGEDFPLSISFLLVNSLIMATAGLYVFKLCKAFRLRTLTAIIGLVSVLTCRWTSYMAGLPLVDSLYFLVVVLTLYAIKTRNKPLTLLVIFLGPWAKESFLFIAPLIFFYADLKKGKQIFLFLASGILVFSFRYLYDLGIEASPTEGLQAGFSHLSMMGKAIQRFFSFHGAYEVFSVVGLWGILLLLLFFRKDLRQLLARNSPAFILWFLGIVLLHALLSTELARMLYLASPVLAVYYALILDKLMQQPMKPSQKILKNNY